MANWTPKDAKEPATDAIKLPEDCVAAPAPHARIPVNVVGSQSSDRLLAGLPALVPDMAVAMVGQVRERRAVEQVVVLWRVVAHRLVLSQDHGRVGLEVVVMAVVAE